MDVRSLGTPEMAQQTATSLRRWADALDANADKQIRDELFDGRGGMCAIGAGMVSAGASYGSHYPFVVMAHADINTLVADAVATIAARQTGAIAAEKLAEDQFNHRRIPLLNDYCFVTFPQFATAARTLASIVEEFWPGVYARRDAAEQAPELAEALA